jgi:hypothetical protein
LGQRRKRFFLKKEAKTSATAPTVWRAFRHPPPAPRARVFWFFFAKKNRLPLLVLKACDQDWSQENNP